MSSSIAMHRLLKRQVKQIFGKDFDVRDLDPRVLELFEQVTETYYNFDQEKAFLNQTVRENRREIKEAYNNMITTSRLAGIGEMMENITHQWKQPLNIILNIVGLLKLEHPEERDLLIIEEQTRYLDQTIADFTNFSSHAESEKKLFMLDKSLNETIKIFEFQARKNGIQVQSYVEKGIVVQGDIGKLNQALLVIFANAKDAFLSRDISPRMIRVVGKRVGEIVVVTIDDNAGGIPDDIIERIFEPYFTTKFKNQGTGIGLSMTYNIVKKMEGDIKAHNHENGATFTIRLPYREEKIDD